MSELNEPVVVGEAESAVAQVPLEDDVVNKSKEAAVVEKATTPTPPADSEMLSSSNDELSDDDDDYDDLSIQEEEEDDEEVDEPREILFEKLETKISFITVEDLLSRPVRGQLCRGIGKEHLGEMDGLDVSEMFSEDGSTTPIVYCQEGKEDDGALVISVGNHRYRILVDRRAKLTETEKAFRIRIRFAFLDGDTFRKLWDVAREMTTQDTYGVKSSELPRDVAIHVIQCRNLHDDMIGGKISKADLSLRMDQISKPSGSRRRQNIVTASGLTLVPRLLDVPNGAYVVLKKWSASLVELAETKLSVMLINPRPVDYANVAEKVGTKFIVGVLDGGVVVDAAEEAAGVLKFFVLFGKSVSVASKHHLKSPSSSVPLAFKDALGLGTLPELVYGIQSEWMMMEKDKDAE